MVPFRLTCLGPPELHGPQGDPIRFRTRKHFALLIYLAVEPSAPHRRDRLATLLWSTADVGEARHSLATALSVLRGRLGPDAFEATRDTVRLLAGRVVTDVAGLERDETHDPEIAAFGPFLEEFDVADAPEFQQWKDAEHARLVPLLHGALARRIDHARRHGDSRRMEAVGRRLERVDDLSEEAARALVEARAMAGDRIGALRIFDRWRAHLAEQLGAQPSPLLERMAERLRRNAWERPTPVLATPVPTAQWKERAFVGRGAEFGVCYAAWEQVRAAEPRHILARGDSGIGKTTLIERFVTAVALEGASVARVQCYELERELPFGMVGGLVAHLLDLPGASATPPEQLAELARLVPKVRQRFPSLPPPLPSVGESARILFTEAVIALVATLAEEQPVVLVVDDMHLADVTSLAVLHLILRRVERLPLMVLLTSSSELGAATPGAQRFVDSADAVALAELRLGPLAAADVVALLDQLLARGADPGPTIRRAIVAGARGNPMVLELLVADWQRRGDACLALSLGAMTVDADARPTEAFRRLVDATLAALDPEARAVVELAAILGQRLNDLPMYALVDMPVARTMRAMTTLAAQRLFRDSGRQLEFANEFVRGQCYVAMAGPLRRLLHGAVADRLLAQAGADEPIPGLEIAWHLVRANRLPEAVPYLLAGGRESIRRGAPHEADLALSTGLPALTGDARRTAILLLAEAMQELGRWADSLQLLDLAQEPFTPSEECCRDVFRIIARRWLGYYELTGLREATLKLLAIATSGIDVEFRVKALAASVRVLALTRNDDHLAMLEDALVETTDIPMDAYQSLHVILVRAWTLAARSQPHAALEELTRGVILADQTATASSIAVRLLLGRGNLMYMLGDYEGAIEPLSRAERFATNLDNMTLRGECAAHLALVEGRLGRYTAQIDWARQALQHFSKSEWSASAIGASYELGLGLMMEGQYVEARASILQLLENPARSRAEWASQASLLCCADVLALCGDERRACMLARRATTRHFGVLHNPAYAGQFGRWIALLALRDGDTQTALERLRNAFPNLNLLDAKDHAEVIGSIVMLESAGEGPKSRRWQDVECRLAKLPAFVSTIMRRLGIHPGRKL